MRHDAIRGKNMKFIIHYNGRYKDSFTISGDSIEEVREAAMQETARRGWDSKDCWSEMVSP